MLSTSIPADLVSKYGAEIAQGMALLAHARQEASFNHLTHYSPKAYKFPGVLPTPEPQAQPETETEQDQDITPVDERVKVYPLLAFAAIRHNLGGAFRAWTVARWLDKQGRGLVTHKDLSNELKMLGVNKFNRCRWVSAALNSKLFRENKGIFYLASHGKAAHLVGSNQVGTGALIDPRALVESGWRARLWSAYLCTLHDRPVSQETKAQITGIDPRTQRNYQAAEPGNKRGNYAKTNLTPSQASGMTETEGGCYFATRQGQVLRRLPDVRYVPLSVATAAPKGRSRKAQKELNSLSQEGQGNDYPTRLFCENPKQLKATSRKLAKDDRYNRLTGDIPKIPRGQVQHPLGHCFPGCWWVSPMIKKVAKVSAIKEVDIKNLLLIIVLIIFHP